MNNTIDLKDIHWMIDMVHNIDVGLVIIEKDYTIKIWNGFMENHSGLTNFDAVDKKLTDLFTYIPKAWLQQKINSVCLLKNKAFTTWEQYPYLFKFKSYRPITSEAEHMYQNVTFLPLTDFTGEVTQICLIVYDVTDVALTRQALERANKKLKHLSRTDSLTQLHNQGYWKEQCQTQFKQHNETDSPAAIIIFDIDHFKRINDNYGHPFGDLVIQGVANLLRENKGESGIAGRLSGEEFTLLLPNTNVAQAKLVAERLRSTIEQTTFKHRQESVSITASFGVSQVTNSMTNYQKWIEIADSGLQLAKNNGRNQIGISEH
jgi:diguanylate cyclase (GGDEF)-like protein